MIINFFLLKRIADHTRIIYRIVLHVRDASLVGLGLGR